MLQGGEWSKNRLDGVRAVGLRDRKELVVAAQSLTRLERVRVLSLVLKLLHELGLDVVGEASDELDGALERRQDLHASVGAP